uniref:Uncharacterized protein n=1 Tax=Kalanchoe fedtschenkoi TaxID=63787 RepID=A0A7N0TEI5_KALFE
MELKDLVFAAAAATGLISISKLVLGMLNFVWVMFLRPPKDLVKTYGSWAVVTGATDGIGQAMAFQLASKGLNLVIIGRNPSKLETTARRLKEKFGARVELKSVIIDFDKFKRDEVVKAIRDGIEGLDVGVLINNAGQGYNFPKFLHEMEGELAESVVNVNVGGLTWATMAVLPTMLKNKRGAIVNIGSGSSSIVPCFPLSAVYGATKAYVEHLSKNISYEYRRHGIHVQCQIPLYVATKMVKLKKSLFTASPESFSIASVRWIGYEPICVPYWPHYAQSLMITSLPAWVVKWYIFRVNLGWRNRAMRKGKTN